MKNTLADLNSHLFEQLERLNETDNESLDREVTRARAVSDIADKIIKNGSLVLEAQKFKDDKWDAETELPLMLEGDKNA